MNLCRRQKFIYPIVFIAIIEVVARKRPPRGRACYGGGLCNFQMEIRAQVGDPLLELQSNAVNTLANQNIPGTNAWIAVIDWLKAFLDQIESEYDTVFMDCNPSFSLYTQIALATTDRIVLPVMADDSSRRAIQNAFSLIYGLKLPSEIYASYAFAKGLPFSKVISGKQTISGHRVQVKQDYLQNAIDSMELLVNHL
jgi:hypothetical protein